MNGAIAERLRIDAERELDHRHVAGDDDLVDLGRVGTGLRADLLGQLGERPVRLPAELLERSVARSSSPRCGRSRRRRRCAGG